MRWGYDYIPSPTGLSFRRNLIPLVDTSDVPNWASGMRYWQDETRGPIQSWKDFDAYPWPRAEELRHIVLEYFNAILPDGMKICVDVPQIFENSTWLMGFQAFCYALHDQPDLIEAICQRVGALVTATVAEVVTFDNVGMLFVVDDLGFYSGTLVSPDVIRRHILPHHRKIAETAHRAGKQCVFHSCGNMQAHGRPDRRRGHRRQALVRGQDPARGASQRRYGDRIAIVGGIDVDFLGRGTEEQVRARTREILEVCGVRAPATAWAPATA